MGKKKRTNQKSIYLDNDVVIKLEEFTNCYPLLPLSMIANAAFRVYFEAVDSAGGIDGNLRPVIHRRRANA